MLQAVIAWARELAFHDERPESESADEGSEEQRSPPEIAVAPASSTSTRADDWVISLRLSDRGPFERLHNVLARAAELRPRQAALASIEDVVTFHALAEDVESHFSEWREAVGNVTELRRDLDEARAVLRRLEQTAGPDACSIVGEGVTPRDATEIADLLESPALEHAPDWLLRSDTDPEHTPRPKNRTEWATVLVDAQRRSLVRLFCNLAVELNEPESLGWIATPGVGDDLVRHLQEWFRRVREFLQEVPPEFRALVEQESPDLRLAHEHAVRLHQLKTEVHEELWANIGDDLRSKDPAARSPLLAAYERAVVFCRDEFGSLDGLSLQLLKARVEKELSHADADMTPAPAGRRVTVRHNFVERTATRATLMFVPAEGGEEYGFLAVPLVLETDQPQALNVRLKWEFKGEARSAWPRDWAGTGAG